jgi:hypothetical protein
MKLEIISYTDMLSFWKQGQRNGVIRRLSPIKKGFFSAALNYAKIKGKITNRRLIDMIEGVVDQIRMNTGLKMLRRGLERVLGLSKNIKMMRIFPSLKKWVNDDAYVFWLGTDLFVNKKLWIWV